MEPHPVPQDILNTEFKLFGSFTLKQFLKLLMACVFGLVIFMMDIPALVKWPIIGVTLFVGVALAIVPRFEVRIWGFLKAIFITPRYVWVKSETTPDALMGKAQAKQDNSQKVSAASQRQKVDLEEISIEKLLAARDNPRKSTPLQNNQPMQQNQARPAMQPPGADATRDNNMGRVMQEVYGTNQPTLQQPAAAQPMPQAQPVAEAAPSAESSAPSTQLTNPAQQDSEDKKVKKQSYAERIAKLKADLKNIVKDESYKEKEAEILAEINDLYHEMEMLDVMPAAEGTSSTGTVTNFQGQAQATGQILFGIVIDKKGNPITNAKVIFDEEDDSKDSVAITGTDGKFTSSGKLAFGDYVVKVEHPNYKFDNYRISIGQEKLPAYRLRAR